MRSTRLLPAAVLLLFAVPAAANPILGAKITQLSATLITLFKIIGTGVGVLGLMYAGVKYNTGDGDAKAAAVRAALGSALVGAAPFVVDMMMGAF